MGRNLQDENGNDTTLSIGIYAMLKSWDPDTITEAARALCADRQVCGNLTLRQWAIDTGNAIPDSETSYHVYCKADVFWEDSLRDMEPIVNLAEVGYDKD